MYTVQILQVIKSYHSTSVLHVSQLAFSSVARKLVGLDKVVAFSYVQTITELASWLQSLGLAGALADGRQVHRNIVCKGLDSNSFLENSLVQFYSRCLDIVSSQFCFERVKHRNVFSWNFLMGAYDGIGHHEDVLFCFQQLRMENVIPDGVTFVHVLSAYSTNQVSLLHAKQIHTQSVTREREMCRLNEAQIHEIC
ncbi:hypothetical protein KP509_1Z200400 [Ceratopteris richardii]|nr:hypothetical protein KP509_1Z200400 [Ceratopteris richardii]